MIICHRFLGDVPLHELSLFVHKGVNFTSVFPIHRHVGSLIDCLFIILKLFGVRVSSADDIRDFFYHLSPNILCLFFVGTKAIFLTLAFGRLFIPIVGLSFPIPEIEIVPWVSQPLLFPLGLTTTTSTAGFKLLLPIYTI